MAQDAGKSVGWPANWVGGKRGGFGFWQLKVRERQHKRARSLQRAVTVPACWELVVDQLIGLIKRIELLTRRG